MSRQKKGHAPIMLMEEQLHLLENSLGDMPYILIFFGIANNSSTAKLTHFFFCLNRRGHVFA
jgi:hypothetical protein